MKFIDIHAFGERVAEISKKIVDPSHSLSVPCINKLACSRFMAYLASARVVFIGSIETFRAQKAVAVKDEFADIAETALTLVTMLSFRVHLK